MSWQGYVDSLKANYADNIAAAGLFGFNGSTWAQENFDHAATNFQEIIDLYNLFADPSSGFANGFTFNGEKFVLVKCQEDALQAKSKGEGKNPLSVEKSNQCMTIARGVDGSNAGSLAIAVGKIADYLKANNY
ncbi:unnamed protein product [Oikopleura dioica]|uniref:Profilin n=1 Tax=Oikopleura dioica TaxID=34765 RepID=E4XZJ2_OIKDI|nr:unnamed protein product [Oikopleura dioica]CBY40001.1 unnamed protein product [Oikopleura dioica]CBY43610.1 unnamed protein product [Oikopleura dioica]